MKPPDHRPTRSQPKARAGRWEPSYRMLFAIIVVLGLNHTRLWQVERTSARNFRSELAVERMSA